MDPFRIHRIVGFAPTLFFYGLFAIAILCVGLAITLTIVPGKSDEDVYKQQLISSQTSWMYNQRREFIEKQDLFISQSQLLPALKEHHIENIQKDVKVSSMKLTNSQLATRYDPYGMGNLAFALTNPLNGSHFEHSVSLDNQDSHCFNIMLGNNNKEALLGSKCEGKNSIMLHGSTEKIMSFEEMIEMGICSKADCKQQCQIYKRKAQSVHNLEKKYTEERDVCQAMFSVKEACFVANDQSELIGGCFKKGQSEIYDFSSKVKETKISVRLSGDPYLKALQISQTYQPYQTKQTNKERKAEQFYFIGAALLFILVVCVVIARIKEEMIFKQTEARSVSSSALPINNIPL